MRTAIRGYEGFYEIDDSGRVYSLDRITTGKHGTQRVIGRPIKAMRHKTHGYYVVNLAMRGKTRQHRLHVLVAEHFIPNPERKLTVNHKLGDKSLNSKDDLEWATHQEQMTHAAANGLTASGERNGGNKISDDELRLAFERCMAGEELQVVATSLGLSRNTLPKGFKRIGLGDEWAVEARRRKSVAGKIRWGTNE